MKIGIIGIRGLPSRGGADRVVEAIVGRLVSRHQITVYCSSLEVPRGAMYPGIELVRVPVLRGKHAHAASLLLMAALDALARKDFDLVHIHNVEACFVLPLLKLKYKVVATSHGQAYARDKWGKIAKSLIRVADWPYIKLSDAVTSVSKPIAEYYSRRYGRHVQYIPNGIDRVSDLDLDAARRVLRSHSVEPGYYVLFAAGRVIPTKGADILLKAYRGLETDLKLVVVGDTSHVPAYEKELYRMADSKVVFISSVDKKTLFGLVRMACLFVFPSTVEAMSMMLMEAAALGAPVICSDIPENTCILPHCLFFRSGDVEDLVRQLEWALHHQQQMNELGSQAKAWVMDNYQWDVIAAHYEQLYRAVLQDS